MSYYFLYLQNLQPLSYFPTICYYTLTAQDRMLRQEPAGTLRLLTQLECRYDLLKHPVSSCCFLTMFHKREMEELVSWQEACGLCLLAGLVEIPQKKKKKKKRNKTFKVFHPPSLTLVPFASPLPFPFPLILPFSLPLPFPFPLSHSHIFRKVTPTSISSHFPSLPS